MLKLSVSGCPKGRGVDQILLHSAGNHFHNLLTHNDDMSRHGDITVVVEVIPNLQADYGGCGFVAWTDHAFNPVCFRIELDADLGYKDSLITLGHEMTHVRQLVIGMWYQSQDGQVNRWNGQLINVQDTHYYDLPWEIEAHGREYGLYHRFVRKEEVPLVCKPSAASQALIDMLLMIGAKSA